MLDLQAHSGEPTKLGQDTGTQIGALYKIRDEHQIWQNPFLLACENGLLSQEDFRYFFSQYYFYSKNFTRLIAAVMQGCDDEYYRYKLSENLWEEGGGINPEERHSELFRDFLVRHLGVPSLQDIEFQPPVMSFFNDMLELCVKHSTMEAAAVLSLATEGIVARLYGIFVDGLSAAGVLAENLQFFRIHIACDDEHARILEELALSYSGHPDWFPRCKAATVRALDLRNRFFTSVHEELCPNPLEAIAGRIMNGPGSQIDQTSVGRSLAAFNVGRDIGRRLYVNMAGADVGFHVDRLPVESEVLDPRLLVIEPGKRNEEHRHAHETLFFVLSGTGVVVRDGERIPVVESDLVHIPRWAAHQTINTGLTQIKILATTDFGLTRLFPGNTDESYRQSVDSGCR